jgi:hypothetical protein
MRRLLVVSLLAVSCGHAAPASPSVTVAIDVLDYLIGDASLWPRVGGHSQHQFVDTARQEVCWVKYANPRTFECWRWDDEFVYHVVDHAIDGNTGESYHFSDGRWMPRRFSGVWSLDVASNRITWFDPGCRVNAARSGTFPYRQRAWVETARDAGPEIGIRDTLVLEYQPYDPNGAAGAPEFFYFARGAGWYEWDRGNVRDLFNRLGGPARSPARDIVCGGL